MNELNKKGLLHTECMTVTGKTLGENIEGCVNKNPEVIRPIDNPYSETGGLAVLKGNLAPDGSVVTVSYTHLRYGCIERKSEPVYFRISIRTGYGEGRMLCMVILKRIEGPENVAPRREILAFPSA